MITNQRHLFDLPDDVTYLDCASNSPHLKTVRQAGIEGLDLKTHPWKVNRAHLMHEGEQARALIADLMGVEPRDMAITPSTAYGVATAAQNLPLSAGQSIIVLEDQFPSHVLPWMDLAKDKGGKIVTVPRPEDYDWTSRVLDSMDQHTAIVAIPPCHWTDGSKLDLIIIGNRCRDLGAAFVIDSTQVTGACPMDIAAIQPDFVACSAYKWLLSPYTLGYLYAAPHRQAGRPLESHNLNHKSEPPGGKVSYDMDFSDGAARYDMSERFNYMNIPMSIAGMTQIQDWGVENIHETLTGLIDYAIKKATELGWAAPAKPYRIGHFSGIKSPTPLPEKIIPLLNAEGIYLSPRGGGLRIAPHLYNTKADIDRLFEVLAKI